MIRNKFKPVALKRIDAAIQVMREVMDHSCRNNPFSVNEAMCHGINYLKSYRESHGTPKTAQKSGPKMNNSELPKDVSNGKS